MNETKKLHLKTIKTHRKAVRKHCWKMGLFWQGLIHDLSKYSKIEMEILKYATGKKSPHDVARESIGYSPSWYHHAHKNKHHFEYWLDLGPKDETGHLKIYPIKIPYKYVIEMFCDMLGASKTYEKENWNPTKYATWWHKRKEQIIIHGDSCALLDLLIFNLEDLGEKEFFKWYKVHKKELKQNY